MMMMMMTCGRARRLLWPDSGPRRALAELEAAREHVASCEWCRGFFEDMRVLAARLHEGAPRPVAPAEVRDRLFAALAGARTATPPNRRARLGRQAAALAAAAAALGALWLGVWRLERPRADDPYGALAEEHMRSVRGDGVVSSDSLEVARWLADRLPFGVEVPIFPEARLTGARLFTLNRRSGAVIAYRLRDRTLSYYVFPTADAAAPGAIDVRVESRDGYRVALWEEPGLGHALVADLSATRMRDLARYCIRQMLSLGTDLRARLSGPPGAALPAPAPPG